MTLKPLGDCVLLEPEPDVTYKEYTGTALVIPDQFKYGPIDQPKWGRILAFGPDCRYNKTCWGSDLQRPLLHEGDRVLYAKYGWAKVPLGEGKHLALVRECDLLVVDK